MGMRGRKHEAMVCPRVGDGASQRQPGWLALVASGLPEGLGQVADTLGARTGPRWVQVGWGQAGVWPSPTLQSPCPYFTEVS